MIGYVELPQINSIHTGVILSMNVTFLNRYINIIDLLYPVMHIYKIPPSSMTISAYPINDYNLNI